MWPIQLALLPFAACRSFSDYDHKMHSKVKTSKKQLSLPSAILPTHTRTREPNNYRHTVP
jgi:hypothetical protein